LASTTAHTDNGVDYGTNYLTIFGNVFSLITGEFDFECDTPVKTSTGVTVSGGTSKLFVLFY
jgi:hypothetical protein